MERKGNLMSFRPDIKVFDATVRDGGLVNNFFFEDDFVKELYEANVKAGVDYMEFGYRASTEIFDEKDFGKWKFCKEEDIREIVGENNTDLKIAVMADVGRTDLEDFLPKEESVIDMVRVATYVHQIPAAIEIIEHCHNLGYETTCNLMAISTATETEMQLALELLGNSNVDVIYLVDSYGSLYPEQVHHLAEVYMQKANKFGKVTGFHAHNNQQLAFANTIEALSLGVSLLDVTMMGMGRGAGNCPAEAIVGFLKNPKFKLMPILKFVQERMLPLKESGLVWGYDIPYLITGMLNMHPRTAIAAESEKDTDYVEFYKTSWDKEC